MSLWLTVFFFLNKLINYLWYNCGELCFKILNVFYVHITMTTFLCRIVVAHSLGNLSEEGSKFGSCTLNIFMCAWFLKCLAMKEFIVRKLSSLRELNFTIFEVRLPVLGQRGRPQADTIRPDKMTHFWGYLNEKICKIKHGKC